MTEKFKKVYIEIGNICNLQCTFCPEVERRQFRLQEEEFLKVLQQVKPWAERVCFHVMGEPLAHPEFARFVQLAGEHEIPVEITTNGTLLNSKTIEALINPAVVQVNFSLQSFFDNFAKAKADRYLESIFSFTELAAQKRPDLYVNYRLWNLENEASGVNEQILKSIEERFSVQINRTVDPAFQKSKRLLGRLYLHFDSRFEWPHPQNPLIAEKGRCYGGVQQIAIHADGTVVPCCLDKEANISLGHIQEQNFTDILKGERLQKLRAGFAKGELVEDLCRRCNYRERFS